MSCVVCCLCVVLCAVCCTILLNKLRGLMSRRLASHYRSHIKLKINMPVPRHLGHMGLVSGHLFERCLTPLCTDMHGLTYAYDAQKNVYVAIPASIRSRMSCVNSRSRLFFFCISFCMCFVTCQAANVQSVCPSGDMIVNSNGSGTP